MKDFSPIEKTLSGFIMSQITYGKSFISFTANTKTLENGKVTQANIVDKVLSIEGFVVTTKKLGKATHHVEFIDGKTQKTVWQIVKYTVK
jgi:hypothetical protein